MKRRRRKLVLMFGLLLVAAMSLSGCKTLMSILNASIQKPQIKYKRMHLRDISFKGMALDFDFELYNPNDVSVTFTHFSYDLKIDGNRLFRGTTKRPIELAARGRSPLRAPFSVEFRQLAKSLLAFFQKKDFVAYHLTLGVGFRTPVGDITLPPLNIRGRVPVPKLPKVRFMGVALGALSFTGAVLNFKLGVMNQGKFPVKIQGLDYQFRVSGTPIGSGRTRMNPLGAGKQQVMTIPFKVNFLSVGMAIANVIRSRKLPYDFQAHLNLGLFKLPIKLAGSANL